MASSDDDDDQTLGELRATAKRSAPRQNRAARVGTVLEEVHLGRTSRAKNASKPRRNPGRLRHAADPASARRSSCDTGASEGSRARQGSWSGAIDGIRRRRKGVGELTAKHSDSRVAKAGGQKRRTPEGRKKKDGGKGKGRVSLGILGVPLPHSWGTDGTDESDDDDFHDDTDEGSAEMSFPAGSSSRKYCGTNTRSRTRVRDQEHEREERVRGFRSGRASQNLGRENAMKKIPAELMLQLIVRPLLDVVSKCALQCASHRMKRLLDEPTAWASLELRPDVIGKRTMRSGRESRLSRQPLFLLARSLVVQPRFAEVISVDLRQMNLGATGSHPDLLLKLFENCPRITSLNLWGSYLEHEGLPQPESAIESMIAEKIPGVQHLALDMGASNRGLRILLKGCRQLKSLHIKSRCGAGRDSSSMHPNDLGMKAFSSVGAPRLETLSIFDKAHIGAAGLNCVLDASSCPELTTLQLARMERVTDLCLEAILPKMDRLKSLVLDRCPIKVTRLTEVIRHCPRLVGLVVAEGQSSLPINSDRNLFINNLHFSAGGRLMTVRLEIPEGAEDTKRWLNRAPLDDVHASEFIRVQAVPAAGISADDRISPFMK